MTGVHELRKRFEPTGMYCSSRLRQRVPASETSDLSDDAAAKEQGLVFLRGWPAMKRIAGAASRYHAQRVWPTDLFFDPALAQRNVAIARPDANTPPGMSPVGLDGMLVMHLDDAMEGSSRCLTAFVPGVWIYPHARGRGLVYELYREAFIVAAMLGHTRFDRNTFIHSGLWIEHLVWSRIADGDLALPAGWRYVPGPSDSLVDRAGLREDWGPMWPAEHLTDQELAGFGYAQRQDTPRR